MAAIRIVSSLRNMLNGGEPVMANAPARNSIAVAGISVAMPLTSAMFLVLNF